MAKVWPDKVTEDDKAYLQTAYGDFDPVFVEAIKAQQDMIEKLITRVEFLEKELSKESSSN